MKLVYVAGKFSAPTRAGVEANIAAAELVGIEVARLGLMPLIPHANTSHPQFEQVQPYPFWIEGTLELLRRSDALLTVSGWEASSGARGEVEEANRLGKPVFHDIAEMARCLIGRDDRDELPTLPDASVAPQLMNEAELDGLVRDISEPFSEECDPDD